MTATRTNIGDSTLNAKAMLTAFLNCPLTIRASTISEIAAAFPGKIRGRLPNFYHNAAAHFSGEDARRGLDHVG
jgi:hypothetical protein